MGRKSMLTKVESDTPLEAVKINHREDVGIADVWLRKNIEQTQHNDETLGDTTVYTADEVYFMHAYTETLADELTDNFDSWWEYGTTWEPTVKMTDGERQRKEMNDRMDIIEGCILSELVYA